MFTRLAPQKAQHSSGFIVQVANRRSVEYIEDNIAASVEVEFGPTTTIYGSTLKAVDSSSSAIVQQRRTDILQRILAGLTFLGGKYEMSA